MLRQLKPEDRRQQPPAMTGTDVAFYMVEPEVREEFYD